MVAGHHLWDEVAVIVDDGHLGCVVVEKFLRSSCLKQEIVVHEFFHKYKICFSLMNGVKRLFLVANSIEARLNKGQGTDDSETASIVHAIWNCKTTKKILKRAFFLLYLH